MRETTFGMHFHSYTRPNLHANLLRTQKRHFANFRNVGDPKGDVSDENTIGTSWPMLMQCPAVARANDGCSADAVGNAIVSPREIWGPGKFLISASEANLGNASVQLGMLRRFLQD